MSKDAKSGKKQLLAIGERIRERRKAMRLTQERLALLCDAEKARICRIEKGKINFTIITLKKICAVLEVSMNDILSGISGDTSSMIQARPIAQKMQ